MIQSFCTTTVFGMDSLLQLGYYGLISYSLLSHLYANFCANWKININARAKLDET